MSEGAAEKKKTTKAPNTQLEQRLTAGYNALSFKAFVEFKPNAGECYLAVLCYEEVAFYFFGMKEHESVRVCVFFLSIGCSP